MEKFDIHSFFVEEVYTLFKPEWVTELNNASDPYIKKAIKRDKGKEKNGWSYHSEPLINKKPFLKIEKWVLKNSEEILINQGFDLKNYRMTMTDLWVQEFPSNGAGHQEVHTHWNGHISGFYFLKSIDNNSFPIFYDSRPGKVMNLLPEKDKEAVSAANSNVHFKIKPGAVMFFNSHLQHSFAVNNTKDPFRFIHWNCAAVLK